MKKGEECGNQRGDQNHAAYFQYRLAGSKRLPVKKEFVEEVITRYQENRDRQKDAVDKLFSAEIAVVERIGNFAECRYGIDHGVSGRFFIVHPVVDDDIGIQSGTAFFAVGPQRANFPGMTVRRIDHRISPRIVVWEIFMDVRQGVGINFVFVPIFLQFRREMADRVQCESLANPCLRARVVGGPEASTPIDCRHGKGREKNGAKVEKEYRAGFTFHSLFVVVREIFFRHGAPI